MTEESFVEVDPGNAIMELSSTAPAQASPVSAPEATPQTPVTDANANPVDTTPPVEGAAKQDNAFGDVATDDTTKVVTNNEEKSPETLTQHADGTVTTTDGTAVEPLAIDPNQLVKLPDGTTAPFHQVIGGTMLKPRYDKALAELQKERDAVIKDKAEVAASKQFLDLAANDVGATVYLQTLHSTKDPQRALEALQAATGLKGSSTAPATPVAAEPPKPGTDEYYVSVPQGIEPGMPEYDTWYAQHIRVMAKKGAREEIEAARKQDEEIRAKREAEESEKRKLTEQATQVQVQRLAENREKLKGMYTILTAERKANVAALPQEKMPELGKILTQTAMEHGLNLLDENWLANNSLTDNDLRVIALKAPLDNLFKGTSAATQQPQTPTFVQPKIDTALHKPINAGSASAGSVPTESIPHSEGNEYIGALNELLAS